MLEKLLEVLNDWRVPTFIIFLSIGWVFFSPAHSQQLDLAPQDHGHAEFWINKGNHKSPQDGSHCCGKNDCMIVDEMVHFTPNGYEIHWPDGKKELIPQSEVLNSEDMHYWRCKRYDGSRRCFFAPPGGV